MVPGANKYNVYRGNKYIKTVGKTASYTDKSVANGTHNYQLIAIDETQSSNDKYSTKSAIAKVTVGSSSTTTTTTTTTTSAPTSPSGFSAKAYSGTAAELRWNSATDGKLGRAVSYEIYRNGAKVLTTNNGSSYWMGSGLKSGVNYRFEIVAIYSNGKKSNKSKTIRLTMKNGNNSY